MQLPHHDPIQQTAPDAMHTIKDVIVHVFNLITGREDSPKVHAAEKAVKRFCMESKEPLCYRLTREDIGTANSRIATINMPNPDFTLLNIFTSTAGLKSHDWKEVRHINQRVR